MWGRLSLREKVMLAVLFVAALGFCCYRFLLTPQLKAYDKTKKELADYQAKLSSAQATAASLKNESARLEKIKEDLKEIDKLFATEMRDGSDIILLGLQAAAKNIEITGIEPGKIKENPYSLEMPLKINVQGDYRKLLAFCNDLENLSNLTEIRNLKVEAFGSSPSPSPGTGGSPGTVSPGTVKATLGIVITSAKTPQTRLHLEEINRWLTGRYNIFEPSAAIAPIPELAGQIELPAQTEIIPGGNAGRTQDQTPTTTGSVYGPPAPSAPEYIWRK